MSDLWRLKVRSEFSAGHALRNYRGKCENMHGHNFMVEVCVQGSELDQATGMLIDFGDLKKYLKNILELLDHCLLNEKPPFDVINPSSENISRYIWEQMQAQLQHYGLHNVSLAGVEVSEKDTQSATYLGPQN